MGKTPEIALISLPFCDVSVRVSPRARRFTLRICRLSGEASLTAPKGASRRAAERFVQDHADWLREKRAATPEPAPFTPGARIPFRGVAHELRVAQRRRGAPALCDGALYAPEGAGYARRIETFLREEARAALYERSMIHARALGASFTALRITDTKSRWGSCSSRGSLSYSWRLILAPPAVLDYLAAHECAHLREMNHGPRFWALVERLQPDYPIQKAWLKTHGPDLHRYGAPPAENNAADAL